MPTNLLSLWALLTLYEVFIRALFRTISFLGIDRFLVPLPYHICPPHNMSTNQQLRHGRQSEVKDRPSTCVHVTCKKLGGNPSM
jgi:hypothetical protein